MVGRVTDLFFSKMRAAITAGVEVEHTLRQAVGGSLPLQFAVRRSPLAVRCCYFSTSLAMVCNCMLLVPS